jgi:hypothetical protein
MAKFDASNRREEGKRFNAPPSTPGRVSTEAQHPTFSLTHIQPSYCLSNCEKQEKAAFADTLHKLSKLTWAQIRIAPKHGCGTEKIARDSIDTGIPVHVTEDVSFFLAFRFDGKKPMVGYRKDEVFHVLWLDRDMTLYDHG